MTSDGERKMPCTPTQMMVAAPCSMVFQPGPGTNCAAGVAPAQVQQFPAAGWACRPVLMPALLISRCSGCPAAGNVLRMRLGSRSRFFHALGAILRPR